jgi:hypothetical protein
MPTCNDERERGGGERVLTTEVGGHESGLEHAGVGRIRGSSWTNTMRITRRTFSSRVSIDIDSASIV